MRTPSPGEEISNPLVRELRLLVQNALDNEMAETAVWYAEKLVTMSGGEIEDVLLLAKSYYGSGEFARAAKLLEKRKAVPRQVVRQFAAGDTSVNTSPELRARLLAARCWTRCNQHSMAAETLEPALVDLSNLYKFSSLSPRHKIDPALIPSTAARALFPVGESPDTKTRHLIQEDEINLHDDEANDQAEGSYDLEQRPLIDLAAAACCLLGRAYAAMENRGRALEWLQRALKIDPRSSEALALLLDRKMLSAKEEILLRDETLHALETADSWRADLYAIKLGTQDNQEENREDADDLGPIERLERVHGLGDDPEVLRARAERLYYRHDPRAAYIIAKRIYDADPFDLLVVPVYVASMLELKESHELFSVAHALVKAYPKQACSWFAVGVYYMLIRKFDTAQRYFHKAAKINPRFAPAWIGFGNAFAAQDESEQAMAAYRSASRLFQGSHLPLLYIGMEYLRTNNLPLAKHFFHGAEALCPHDPAITNELGVVALKQAEYNTAVDYFFSVLERFQRLPDKAPLKLACESSVYNLGHTYVKLRNFPKAVHFFQLALTIKPYDPTTRSALAAVYHVLGGPYLHKAIEYYHMALAIRPNDVFAAEMLTRALKDVLDIDDPYEFPHHIPTPNIYNDEAEPTQDDDFHDATMRDASPVRRDKQAPLPGDFVHAACDIDQD